MFDSSGSGEVSPWVRGDEVEVVWKKNKTSEGSERGEGEGEGKERQKRKKRKREFRRVEKKNTK